jgi:hypothetical protein
MITTDRGYMTFAGGFAEANVAKPVAIAKHVFAVVSCSKTLLRGLIISTME